ncbi:hypothetical protein [Variovorax sp. LG9.2]|jgi:hypothetical protein|uniref:hypothetical protein n=1 Tax=Variovorax sp. LG9.2 TaxID=3048626 RepID=UPI002B238372|nr:hypothetical protein [Variovorax sp. LG9.2]
MPSDSPQSLRRLLRGVLLFIGLFALVWVALDFAHQKLRYVQAGSDLVLEEKYDKLSKQALFSGQEKYRVIAMGNSKTLSSFKPDVFDAAFPSDVRSYNFGLPGESQFLPVLRSILASGNRPTHLLLQLPWAPPDAAAKALPLLKDDNRILMTLIPFRRFFRDLTLFVFQSLHTGVGAEWMRIKGEIDSVEKNRGWYFISGQSRYPNGQLPDDFALASDNAQATPVRALAPSGDDYAALLALAKQYEFKVVLVPWSARTGEYAPAENSGSGAAKVVSQSPYIAERGPNYWLYPPPSFSDPVHMNSGGAEAYTKRLAAFLKDAGELK